MIQAVEPRNMPVKQVGAKDTLAKGRVCKGQKRTTLSSIGFSIRASVRKGVRHARRDISQAVSGNGRKGGPRGWIGGLSAGRVRGRRRQWSDHVLEQPRRVWAAGLLQEEHREALREGKQGH